ncbi:MAG: glycosyltransferase family 4 protein [Steroidobacteraceae bacterium]
MKANVGAFAFIKIDEFSHTNRHVLSQLRARFPDLRADVIDVGELGILRKDLPRFVLAVAKEYGLSACLSRKRFQHHVVKTRQFFHRAREALLQRLKGKNYAFTFQTQSLFDASIPGTPHFIYTDHTHLENLKYPVSAAITPMSRRWAELERSAYQNACMVFTMSANISRSLVEQYGCVADRVECVYAGSNVSVTASHDIDSARFGAKNILFVGVDWERKGGPVLLDAFRSLRRLHPQASLTIVGCTPEINEPGVRIEGHVPLSELAKYYRSASIFCLPTLNEPFGIVFLEAFSYGLPIVATRLGAIPEIVSDGESGYLVKPQDVGQLADRLNDLLENPARCAQFGLHGRQWVHERYSWEGTGHRLASHIRRAAKLTTASTSELTRSSSASALRGAA